MTADFSDRCICGRVGDTYALLLCTVDAPIPFVLTPRGQREARRLRQWDVLWPLLDQRVNGATATTTKRRRRSASAIRTVRSA